ncbi:MAG: family 78 glycoside hydrolase catalytic domain [Planctomycetia bacterium]|nr:family 78 glycoside hydrolase catalytic domain [Planctomycetia bacterium]
MKMLSALEKTVRIAAVLFTLLALLPTARSGETSSEGEAAFAIGEFSVELLHNPQGIDVANPQFGWKLQSPLSADYQTAWQIQLFPAKCIGQPEESPRWDSGRVESDQQTFVTLPGEPLPAASCWHAKLTVWNREGDSATATADFSTGLYPDPNESQPWKGKWIGLKHVEEPQDVISLADAFWIAPAADSGEPGYWTARKTFQVQDAREVLLALACDDNGTIWLNGNKIGPCTMSTAVMTDVTQYVQQGENTLVLEVMNGGANVNPTGAVGAVLLRNGSGEETSIVTDKSWRVSPGRGPDWFAATFDDSNWAQAHEIAKWSGECVWNDLPKVIPSRLDLPARYLSHNTPLPAKEIQQATIWISGLGLYELFVNGIRVGDAAINPIYTDYTKRVAYNTWDVTDILRTYEAKSVDSEHPVLLLSVLLGNGRFFSPRSENSRTFGEPRLLFQMQIRYVDGSSQLIVSDESWKISDQGPIRTNNEFDGETYDARSQGIDDEDAKEVFLAMEPNGHFTIVPTCKPVDIMEAPGGKMVSQMMPGMGVNMEIKPKSLVELRPGVWIYDFGQNFVGSVRLKVKGPAGTTVKMRHAETLQTEGPGQGELYMDNLRTALCTDRYILQGNGREEVYEPHFAYHGFRFVELTGFPGTPDLETLTGRVIGTSLPLVGRFECSSKTVTEFFKNVEWGTRGNYLSMPVDCPQRDERQGWQGDRAEESKGEMFLFDNITLYRKWMQDIEDSQREDGNVSDVAPNYWQLYGTNVTWPSAQTIVPYSLYQMYGDTYTIARHYDSRVKWLTHLETFLKEDGTIDKDNYGDWCVPPEEQHLIHSQDPARQTNRGLLATAYLYYNYRLTAEYADMLNKPEDATLYREKADKIKSAFNKVYYNAEKGQYDNGTQTSSVLPLAFGLVPESEKERVFASLVNNIENVTDGHIGTGLIGGQWINRVLVDNGRPDLAWKFATNTDYPSWGYMLAKGATTVWELWNGDTADPAMNSGNHVMLVGDYAISLFENFAGIKSDAEKPGFKHIIMKPIVVNDLTWVRASYESIYGTITSHWNLDTEKSIFSWTVDIPVNTTATVSVPTSDPASVSCKGLDLQQTETTFRDGRLEFNLPAGKWTLTSRFQR